MCGRFTLRTPPSDWVQQLFGDFSAVELPAEEFQPRFNVAPTQNILVAVGDRPDQPVRITPMRWGLLPPWAKDKSVGARMINARSETAKEKSSFKGPLASQRCVIISDGYYEWKKVGATKQPFWIRPSNGECFLMAGLWETNFKLQDAPIFSTTILTTSANASLASLHDRMPVLIEPSDLPMWLDSSMNELGKAEEIMTRANDEYFTVTSVSTYVNNARNEGPQCIDDQ